MFQHNEVTGDRRISGTLASLAGLDAAVEAGDELAVTAAIDRIVLAHTIVLGWGGLPVLWMGDELALRNDPAWDAEPAHADDNRWAHRPRMPWDVAERRHQPGTIEHRVFHAVAHRAQVRAGLVHLDASVASEPLDPTDPGVLAVLRRHPVGPVRRPLQRHRHRPAVPAVAPARARPRADGGDRRADRRAPADRRARQRADSRPYAALWLVAG